MSPQTNAHQTLLLRHALLLQVAAASPVPLPATTLLEGLRLAGHPLDSQQLAAQLSYLCDKGQIHPHTSELSHGLQRYSLSATGRDYLEAQGLI